MMRVFHCLLQKAACLCISQQHSHIHVHYYSWLYISSCVCVCVSLCVYPRPFPFTAVISAHPIHSLDNHHHHYHMGSLASPTRSYLYHQGSGHPRPHACATPISHLDRVDSSGETRHCPLLAGWDTLAGQRSRTWSHGSFIDLSFLHSSTCSCHLVTFIFSVFRSVTNPFFLIFRSYFVGGLLFSPQISLGMGGLKWTIKAADSHACDLNLIASLLNCS